MAVVACGKIDVVILDSLTLKASCENMQICLSIKNYLNVINYYCTVGYSFCSDGKSRKHTDE